MRVESPVLSVEFAEISAEQVLLEHTTWYIDDEQRIQLRYRGGKAGLAAANKILRRHDIEPHGDWRDRVAWAIALTPLVYHDDGTLAPRGN